MNSSERHNSDYEDDNTSNTESSNTPDDSKEQDDKNIESLFETPNFPNQSSDDDLMSLFASSGMLEEDNLDLFNSPEMMSIGEETDLFTTFDMKEETGEMDLFNTPEITSTSNELDSNQFGEMDILATPEMMSIGEETELTPEMMSMQEETSEMDLFNTPEIMSMQEETIEMDLFNTPEIMSTSDELDSNQFGEMDILATPEMMSMQEEIDILATPEIISTGEDTSEMDLFNTPEMTSTSNELDSNQFGEIDILATPEMMSISGDFDINQPAEIKKETSEIDLLADHDLASQTDEVNQLIEVTIIESEIETSQQPEMAEETNDTNISLGAAVAVGASIPLLEERLIVDINKQKIGEVVVRKEIETEMVQVPIRREKLIIEQIGAETIQLAEIDLGSSEIQGVELATIQANMAQVGSVAKSDETIVSGEFTSAKIASLLLNAIALERNQGCKKIRIEIVVDNAERQQTYQEWVDRCSIKPSQNQKSVT